MICSYITDKRKTMFRRQRVGLLSIKYIMHVIH